MDDHGRAMVPTVIPAGEIQRVQMHPMVQLAMAAGQLDPGTLEKMMDLQERWEKSEAEKAYVRAMAAMKATLAPVVGQDKKNEHHGWKYSSLAAFVDHITEPMSAHGFSLGGDSSIADNGDVVVTVEITHVAGHSKRSTLHAPPDFGAKSSKTGQFTRSHVQAVMATQTSLRRTLIQMMLGLSSGDVPDADDRGPDPDHVDTARNLQAVAHLVTLGQDRAACEAKVGRPLEEWTAADLATLRTWAKDLKAGPVDGAKD